MPLDLTAVTDKSLRFHSKDAFSDSAMKAVFVQMESLVILWFSFCLVRVKNDSKKLF